MARIGDTLNPTTRAGVAIGTEVLRVRSAESDSGSSPSRPNIKLLCMFASREHRHSGRNAPAARRDPQPSPDDVGDGSGHASSGGVMMSASGPAHQNPIPYPGICKSSRGSHRANRAPPANTVGRAGNEVSCDGSDAGAPSRNTRAVRACKPSRARMASPVPALARASSSRPNMIRVRITPTAS
ncbi:hypothetical protein MMAR_2542 [Mycobacterium marinum M]|uniref:Uncharacterized protein n=1 Tax=Mycobacterium marinum (strain ATCC BAA-535 / M) TaxID=216594 RepID=B2HRW0_MYCMM|nr:hypothetical protein MMAR_2542 [Mycobacterium marinum M]